MFSFKLDDELESFRHEVRSLAEKEFAPRAAYWDEHEEYPEANKNLLAELGYLGMLVPEAYGGSGLSLIHGVVFLEELARVCFNTALVGQLYLNGPAKALAELGTEEQKQRILPGVVKGDYLIAISISEPGAGSAVTDLSTNIRKEGDDYILNGTKCFTTAGIEATHSMVFARFGDSKGARGIGAVLVEKGMEGFTTGKPERKMGGCGVKEAELHFDNVRIPKENIIVEATPYSNEGFKRLMSSFGPERVGNAGMCVGISQGAYETALAYSETRKQFGRPIAEFQGIQWKIADMATQLHAARLMVYRAATNLKNGFPDPHDCAMAKLYSNEMAQRITNEALQIHGHYGYCRDYPLERMVRDARGFSLGGGTPEILRNTIAAQCYGRTFNQRRS
ncbi:MAG: butyryl-CoA dehydrogenase [Gammaproteobacteria bacterium]|nr:MAG: butyryl-CoA dehydrogenase [Gammaproteobacteria bacterium]RLA24697.1 MAG: butyryl-CoA dehydrogenase [Gammaproteobacteria bacterium]